MRHRHTSRSSVLEVIAAYDRGYAMACRLFANVVLTAAFLFSGLAAQAQKEEQDEPPVAPGSCAKATLIGDDGTRREYRLTNKCPFPVKWEIYCGVGAINCAGHSVVSLDEDKEKKTAVLYAFVLDGPRRL